MLFSISLERCDVVDLVVIWERLYFPVVEMHNRPEFSRRNRNKRYVGLEFIFHFTTLSVF